MNKTIAIGISPNTQKDDIKKTYEALINIFSYQKGKYISFLEQWFKKYFTVTYAISFNSGRVCLYEILKAIDLKMGDEVILQAFTCVVVPDAIIAFGGKPVYADITGNITIDIDDMEKKISKKTKAIIVQHTFGIPAEMNKIIRIARKYKLFVIEDVAHTIGATYEGKKLGTLGDISFFSFGRDKAFSSVFGGMIITDNKVLGERIIATQKEIPFPSIFWIVQQLLHPIAFSYILPLYDRFFLGKILIIFLQRIKILSLPVSKEEKQGKFSIDNIKRFPNALAFLVFHQLEKIDAYNERRKNIASIYMKVCSVLKIQFPKTDAIPLLRFPVFVHNAEEMKKYFRKNNVYLGNWYAHVIDPKGSSTDAVYYTKNSCPKAESIAKQIVNLPTYPKMEEKDTKKIVSLLKSYAGN
jgi:dTDP-4-amino-4,6-dideoxygalactose transaminase